MRGLRIAAIAITLAAGCKRADHDETAATPVASPACAKAKSDGGPVAWFEDDFADALACAQARHVPIVLDEWAPWCHTCLSMKQTVLTDPSFEADDARFVFAAIDTDRDTSADQVAHYPIAAWPTYYVIDAKDNAVLARFVGSASVAQFHELLDTAARAAAGQPAGADWHLLSAERALAGKDLVAADQELTAALAAAPPTWARRSDVLGTLLQVKRKRDDLAGCLTIAEAELDHTGNTASASDFLVLAMDCATERAKDEPDRVRALRERAAARWRALIDDTAAPLSVDDRSDALANLRETEDALGEHQVAVGAANEQRDLLDAAAAKAPTPLGAMTYNWPRAEVYVYLGHPLDLVPALEKSAKELPTEYDPRARLAWLLWKAGKFDDAARWADQALAMVYGPRKARVLTLRADIAAAAHDVAAERTARAAAVSVLERLPPGQAQPEALAKARIARDAIATAH